MPHGLWSVTREQVGVCECVYLQAMGGVVVVGEAMSIDHEITPCTHAYASQIWTFLKDNNFNTVRIPFSAALALQVSIDRCLRGANRSWRWHVTWHLDHMDLIIYIHINANT